MIIHIDDRPLEMLSQEERDALVEDIPPEIANQMIKEAEEWFKKNKIIPKPEN